MFLCWKLLEVVNWFWFLLCVNLVWILCKYGIGDFIENEFLIVFVFLNWMDKEVFLFL